MKSKKLLLPIIILIAAMIVSAALACITGIVQKPEIETQEFPFSITYKYNSETKTLNGTYVAEYYDGDTVGFEQIRYWSGYVKDNDSGDANNLIIAETEEGTMYLCPNIFSGYVMGDPQYADNYSEEEPYQPYGMFYDKDGIENTDAQILKAQGLEIISWDYPEPIENEFVFSHISPLSGDIVLAFVLIAFVALILCIIFVKRDKEVAPKILDKISTILNFVVGIVLLPFITICCALSDINGGGEDLIYQITYCIPAISVLCIALSVSLRRRGFSKISMLVQFIGPLMFAIILLIDGFSLY